MNTVEIRDVEKAFSDTPVLKNISLTVHKADIYGLLGPNGSGKTTTLRILLGIVQRDRGTVTVLGMDPVASAAALRKIVNALPESHGVYGWMSPQAYLCFFAGLYGVLLNSSDCRHRLKQVGLDPNDKRPVKTFSQGMKQRLGIARAMVNDPEILFLDEPTNGLDPRGRREIHNLLLALNRERGVTIILSTHILDDVERLCNRIAILDKGKVRYEGSLAANQQAGSVRYRFHLEKDSEIASSWSYPNIVILERNNGTITCLLKNMSPAEAIKKLVQDKVPIVEAERLSGGLEELYFNYTAAGIS